MNIGVDVILGYLAGGFGVYAFRAKTMIPLARRRGLRLRLRPRLRRSSRRAADHHRQCDRAGAEFLALVRCAALIPFRFFAPIGRQPRGEARAKSAALRAGRKC
jgi:hypothetical protein